MSEKSEKPTVVTSDNQSIAALDAAIEREIADAESGRARLAREVFDRLEAKYRMMIKREKK